jgi:cysteine sulfinate desulfinase/cysteine desulfurase-like protein
MFNIISKLSFIFIKYANEAYEPFRKKIEEAAKNNPYPFKDWFPEGNRVYIPFSVKHKELSYTDKYVIELLKANIPGVEFNGLSGDLDRSLYTVLNVSLPPSEENRGMLLFNLDLGGISASGGSACSSGASVGSHVLRAIHHSPERDSVRFSFSRFNTIAEIVYTVEKLRELYAVSV